MLVCGCTCQPNEPGIDAGAPHEADSPLAQRFLTDVLPWPVSAEATSAGLTVNAGLRAQPRLRQPRYKPVALSAASLGVVFPPADRVGFDIAYGGLDAPWQRAPLTDIGPARVASLDAVRDGTGGAWVALRLLDRKEKLVLLHWVPGQPVATERLDMPVGINPIRLPYLEACNDVTLGVSPSGALDFVVRSDPNPLETLLFHGRRQTPGASFVWQQVANGRKARAPVPQGTAWDFGCTSALAYDGLGRAVLAVLVQQTGEASAGVNGRATAVFTEGRDGRFWPKETAFMTLSDRQPTEFRGLLDLAAHPSGYVFGGPAVEYQVIPGEATVENRDGWTPYVYLDAYHPWYPRSRAFTGARLIASDYRFAASSGERLIGVQSGGQPVPRRGGKILADGCGQFALAVTDWDDVDEWHFNTLGKWCSDPRPAPVFRRAFDGVYTASFAHGPDQPYSVGVCLDAARQSLGVCFGGHVGRAQTPEPVQNVVLNPLTFSSVTHGQRDVSPDAGPSLEFALPVRDVTGVGELYDLDSADKVSGQWALVPNSTSRYQFSPRTPLKPQNHYRLVVGLPNQSDAGPAVLVPWQSPAGGAVVLDFVTAGPAPVVVDVWSERFGLQPQFGRNDAGEPELVVDDQALVLLGREPIRLNLTGQIADDFGRSTIDAGLIRRADGGLLPDGSVPIELDSRWVDVPAPRDAGELETFVIELPMFFDRDGRAFEDRRVWLKTGYWPLEVRSTVPVDQSLESVAPSEVLLRVNRPDVESRINATYFSIEQVSGLDAGTPVATVAFTLAAALFEVRLTPTTPFTPGASYRVISRITPTPRVLTSFSVAP